MQRKLQRLSIVALLLLVAMPLSAVNLEGVYYAKGKLPEGKPYQGIVLVTPSEVGKGVFAFHWRLPGSEYYGTGTVDGNKISVEWGDSVPIVYEIRKNGEELQGKWGAQGRGVEVLYRNVEKPVFDITGNYTVTGQQPNKGSRYTGTAVITSLGPKGYELVWDLSGSIYRGIGVLSGNTFVVDWGDPYPVIYTVNPKKKELSGLWGADYTGKDILKKK